MFPSFRGVETAQAFLSLLAMHRIVSSAREQIKGGNLITVHVGYPIFPMGHFNTKYGDPIPEKYLLYWYTTTPVKLQQCVSNGICIKES